MEINIRKRKRDLKHTYNQLRTLYEKPKPWEFEERIIALSLRIALEEIGLRKVGAILIYIGPNENRHKSDTGWRKAFKYYPLLLKVCRDGQVGDEFEAEIVKHTIEIVRLNLVYGTEVQ